MNTKNEERFTGKADVYKKYRASYPKELFDYLYSETGFRKDSIIADIGSGTGIFSRLLLDRGSNVYCVEPNNDMRCLAEEDLKDYNNFVSVKATAENTGLHESSIDFVTAAQAFHWFDRQIFKAECQRILKSGGKIILVWNTRDYNAKFVKEDYVIRERYCIDTKGLGKGGNAPSDLSDFFSQKTKETFSNDMVINREAYIGMNLSRSYSPREDKDPDKYHGLVKELNALFDAYNEDGIIRYPQFTECYIGTV
ncbi:MAG: class I SAM-dependent methyltransferase [Oscillospiraceae bacterium]|nr:class I SAM-dependent methyltransferase [Oscillospiraceae bacterium]